MATNEILQFASTDTGTNLLTQAEYAADAQRTTGNQPGIARSKLVNKSLRQASLLAAGLAEFIADYQANNVTDSLTPQNIADYLLAAIKASFPVATTTVQGKVELATSAETQAGSDSTLAVTPAGLNSRAASETLTGLIELATSAEVAALSDAARAITPLRLPDAFAKSFGNSGYVKLPNGFLIQWGRTGYFAANDSKFITYPFAFQNAVFYVLTMAVVNTSSSMSTTNLINYPGLASMTLNNGDPDTNFMDSYWVVFGW